MHLFGRRAAIAVAALLAISSAAASNNKKAKKSAGPSPLDLYIQQAKTRKDDVGASAGSLWSPSSRFNDLGSDLRAAHVDDIVTIIVNEQTSAVSQGVTKTSRTSSASASVTAFGKALKATSPWANLAGSNGAQALDGEGTTSRTTTLTSTLGTRVVGVLPNGYLIVEGVKTIYVNSENQVVSVRGVVRPLDLNADNTVSADRLADVEVKVNGKGVVNDATRRPNILYRVLLGLLPF